MARNSPSHVARTFRQLNLHLVDEGDCIDGTWPMLEPSHTVPLGLTTFLPSQASKHPDEFVHFFIEDYRFERLWTEPERYIDVLSRYAGMIMPDFSTYRNMPIPMQLWNMYRARAIASFYQRCGIDVIPNLMYADERTYGPAFSGLPIGGSYIVCATGTARDEEARRYFNKGLLAGLERVMPDTLLVYGGRIDVSVPCEVVYYTNDNTARVRKNVPYISSSERKLLDVAEPRAERATDTHGTKDAISPMDHNILLAPCDHGDEALPIGDAI